MDFINYIIAILLVIIIALLIMLLVKNNASSLKQDLDLNNNQTMVKMQSNFNEIGTLLAQNNERVLKEIAEFKVESVRSNSSANVEQITNLNQFKEKLLWQLSESINQTNKILDDKLLEINRDVNINIEKNFAKSEKSYLEMVERLTKIDEAQKKLESLSTNIVSLQDILSDKKSRGAFGEVQLNNILRSIFGERQEYYQIQAKLSNGMIADAIIKVPEPVGTIAIDSKFPLEGYKKMLDIESSEVQRKEATKQFKNDLKKHIDDIASKYIIANETTNSAILFLPAEAIFAQVNANHQDVIDYANKKRVWLTSPTTLMATLTSIQVIVQNVEQSKYAKVIQEELVKLNEEFIRYTKRWDELSSHLGNVSEDAKKIHTTTKKIATRFDRISSVKFEEKDDLID